MYKNTKTIKYSMIVAIIPVLMLTVPNVNAQNRIDCEDNPDHKYCNGDQGKTGIPFCDLDYQELGFTFCRDRNAEPPRVDCDENPNDSLCNGDRGIDGNPFCDIQYQEEGRKHGCYDRNDNPQEYCEKYREIDDDFCKIIEN